SNCGRTGGPRVRQHRSHSWRGRVGARARGPDQRFRFRPRASASLYGRPQPALRVATAGLDADGGLGVRPARISGRDRSRRPRPGVGGLSMANFRKIWWQDFTAAEFDGLDPVKTIAVLPTAALEQHGPHLPVGVDTFLNRGPLDMLTKRMPADLDVRILPV